MSDVLTVLQTDALTGLQGMADETVQTCVTSPPYWSLRDYGIKPMIWDETIKCEHKWTATAAKEAYTGTTRWQHTTNGRGEEQPDAKRLRTSTTRETRPEAWGEVKQGAFCASCSAWRGCLGLEPTPELYVRHLVRIFREVKRVLRKDGTLWLNLGDSYAGSGRGMDGDGSAGKAGPKQQSNAGPTLDLHDKLVASGAIGRYWVAAPPGLKQKDLVGIPWMVAFALRSDGWYLRSDIVWAKPNPMPESVTDRPTRSHEYIFLLTKNRKYFYDALAIAEPAQTWTGQAATFERSGPVSEHIIPGQNAAQHRPSRNGKNSLRGQGANRDTAKGPANREGRDMQEVGGGTTRNKRSVWVIATAPFPEAHFATFPTDLVIPCVLAGCPPGGTVLDPFAGSGTTGKVAIELGRKATLIEPKAEYVAMIERRCQTTIGLPI